MKKIFLFIGAFCMLSVFSYSRGDDKRIENIVDTTLTKKDSVEVKNSTQPDTIFILDPKVTGNGDDAI